MKGGQKVDRVDKNGEREDSLKDHCITIQRKESSRFKETPWKMTIDLREIARITDKREKDLCNGGSYVVYPINRARKLIRLILDNGTPEDFGKCEVCFRKNKKLYKWWQKYSEEAGYDFNPVPDDEAIPFC